MDKSKAAHQEIANHCCAIEDLFKPGAKVSVIVRNPGQGSEPHSADIFVSNDNDFEALIEAIHYLRKREEQKL